MIFVMSEQLAAWVPSLYREANADDVRQGRLANVLDAEGQADLVIQQGAGRYVIFAAAGARSKANGSQCIYGA